MWTLQAENTAVQTSHISRAPQAQGASLVAQLVKNPPAMQETWVPFLGWEDPLEKGKATHSSTWPGELHGWYRNPRPAATTLNHAALRVLVPHTHPRAAGPMTVPHRRKGGSRPHLLNARQSCSHVLISHCVRRPLVKALITDGRFHKEEEQTGGLFTSNKQYHSETPQSPNAFFCL